MSNINKNVAAWIKSANGNGQRGTALALESLQHMAATGDSTVFAKLARVNNAAYVKNLKLIAKAFGYKIAKLDTTTPNLVPASKEVAKVSKGMVLDSKALDTLTKAVTDKLTLGGTLLAKEFGWTKPAPAAKPEPEAEPETGAEETDAPILMIEGPKVENSVLDLVLAYMQDMGVPEIDAIIAAGQARMTELANIEIAKAG